MKVPGYLHALAVSAFLAFSSLPAMAVINQQALTPQPPLTLHPGKQGTTLQPNTLSQPSSQIGQAPSLDNNIRDIHGPVLLPKKGEFLIPLAIAGAALAALALLVYFIRRKKKTAPALPAHEIAFAELARAKTWIKENKGVIYAQRLSEILRQYVEARFLVHSTRQTTDELLHQLRLADLFEDRKQQLHDLKVCLDRCDLAKFAHLAPDNTGMLEMESMAQQFIETTRPVETEGEATGGYLVGYLPAVYVIGKISARIHQRAVYDVLAMICGTVVLYGCGVTWLKIVTGMTPAKAMAVGLLPFLIGDALKIAAAAAVAKALRPVVRVGDLVIKDT